MVDLNRLCNFFRLLARKPNLEKNLFIQSNSFIIFTCLNPGLLMSRASGSQVGKREDCLNFGRRINDFLINDFTMMLRILPAVLHDYLSFY